MESYEPSRQAIEIAAKAGFITRELWQDFIFGGEPKTATDKRRFHWAWKKLVDSEYLKKHTNRHLSNILILERKKARVVRQYFGAASYCPFESQFHHDEQLLRGVLKVRQSGILRHWLLETELKSDGRQEFELTSQGKKLKHPDAVLYMKAGKAVPRVAVELELTLKNKTRYGKIIGAYQFIEDMPLILFVCGEPVIERALKKAIREDRAAFNGGRFGFMSLNDWQKNPIDGEIICGQRTTTLRRIAGS